MRDLRTRDGPLMFIGVGLLVIVLGVRLWLQGRRIRRWPRTRGEVTVSRLEEGTRDRWFIRQYRAVVSYAFDIAGATWTGYRISVGEDANDLLSRSFAQARLDRYPIGTQVDVYFDPCDPSKAVLERGVSRYLPFGLLFGVGLMALGALMFFGATGQ